MLIRTQHPFDHAYQGLDLPSGSTIVAAVSGGSDSVALLVSLHDHLARNRPDLKLTAVTIDHCLRTQSAIEAKEVARLCAMLGIQQITRKWAGDKPANGIPAAARAARYRLLCDTANQLGATVILTGHTANDQAETIAMRQQRGSGRGLAGMAPATLLNGQFWLLRPLLAEQRSSLRAYLKNQHVEWIDDPTNDDDAYERPRIRRELAARTGIGGLLALGREAAHRRRQLGVKAAGFIRRFVSRPTPGLFQIAPELVMEPDRDAVAYTLRILLSVAGGQQHLPDEDKTRALLEALARDGRHVRQTLSRSVIDRRKDAIFVYRENRNLPDPAPADDACDWDKRYRIEGLIPASNLSIIAFGQGKDDPAPIGSIANSILKAARAAEPAAITPVSGPRLLEEPDIGLRVLPVAAPWAALLPSFDLAPARAVAALTGAAIPPEPPYRGHSEGQA